MKTATIFLVAVTAFTSLFQQYSAAPQLFSLLDNLVGTVDGTVRTTVGGVNDIVVSTLDDLLATVGGDQDKAYETTEDMDSILSKLRKAAEPIKEKGAVKQYKAAESVVSKEKGDVKQYKAAESIVSKEKGAVKQNKAAESVVSKEKDVVKQNKAAEPTVSKEKGAVDNTKYESKRKTNDAVDDTNDKFKNLVVKAIENCKEYMGRIVNAVKNDHLTAACYYKKGLKKAMEYLDGFKDLVERAQSDLEKAATSRDETLLKDLAARIPKNIADTKAAMPGILANLKSSRAVFEENMEKMINEAETVLVAIEELLAVSDSSHSRV